MDVDNLQQQINLKRDKLQRQIGVRDSLVSQRQQLVDKVENDTQKLRITESALNFVENAVRSLRKKVLDDVEVVVNEAVKNVYDNNAPRFECEIGIKRDRSSVIPWFYKKLNSGEEIRRGAKAFGGGVGDVVSLMLRMVLLHASGSEPIIIADEPFRFLGKLQAPKAAMLLYEISHRLGVQTIITTHHDSAIDCCDTGVHLELNENDSVDVTLKEKINEPTRKNGGGH